MELAAVGRHQHGAFTAGQAYQAGWTRHALAHALARGRLVRLHRGVFADPVSSTLRSCRWSGALLAAGRGAVLSHATALEVLDVPGRPRGPEAVHVTVPLARGLASPAGLVVHRSARLIEPSQVRLWHGLAVTTLPRTLLDCCAELDPAARTSLLAGCLQRRRTTLRALEDALVAAPSAPGAAALGRALATVAPGGARLDSVFEVAFARWLAAIGCPAPEYNGEVRTNLGPLHVDVLWRDRGVGVELLGAAFHLTPQDWERDVERLAALAAAGVRIIGVTWRQFHGHRIRVERYLRAVLAPPGVVTAAAAARNARGEGPASCPAAGAR